MRVAVTMLVALTRSAKAVSTLAAALRERKGLARADVEDAKLWAQRPAERMAAATAGVVLLLRL